MLETIITIVQITSAILLVILILLQRSESSVGGAFGGGDDSEGTGAKRRGSEKFLFIITFVLAGIFVVSVITPFVLGFV